MQGFSSSFLIFFYQIALGGLFALAGTPFHEIERAFYKSTAGVLYVIALLGLSGKSSLYWQTLSRQFSLSIALEVAFHVAFIVCFSCYLISLWTERQTFRARSFASTVLIGTAGLALSAHGFTRRLFFRSNRYSTQPTFFSPLFYSAALRSAC